MQQERGAGISLRWSEKKMRDLDILVFLVPGKDIHFLSNVCFNSQGWMLQIFVAELSQHFENYVP